MALLPCACVTRTHMGASWRDTAGLEDRGVLRFVRTTSSHERATPGGRAVTTVAAEEAVTRACRCPGR